MNKIYQTNILNNQYAPGVATYGIDGKDGEKGATGTSIYFTTYNLEYGSENEMDDILVKINQNKILTSYVDKTNEREYAIGDLILDVRGYLYNLYKDNNNFKLNYISKLNINDSTDFFQLNNNRVVVTESGLDLSDSYNDSLNSIKKKSTFPLRIFSETVDGESGRNNLMSFVCRDYNNNEKYLNIFFDAETDSFHFESESAIVFDTSAFFVNENDQTESFTDYYKIEPYNNPLGLIHKVFSEAEYEIDTGFITINNVNFTNYANMDIYPEFLKIYVNNKHQNSTTEIYEELTEYIITIPNDVADNQIISLKITPFMQNILSRENIDFKISLVKGIEVFINKKQPIKSILNYEFR